MGNHHRSDKGTRLVAAFDTLLDEKPFNEIALADIAEKADVPLGNVYYYFKTKKSLAAKVRDLRGITPATSAAQKDLQNTINELELALLELKS